MKSVKGTQTEKNILTAFVGESQARNKYTYFASAAKKEGFVQISAIFTETADQEKEHAKRLFKLLEGGEVKIEAAFPAGVIASTSDNLKEAMEGETYEWTQMYPEFAAKAREEGFEAIATIFESIAVAEKQHARRYEKLKNNVDTKKVFKKDKAVIWRCLNCGYITEAVEAPKACPACNHAQDYFEVMTENW
jgi:rubrerythrin